MMNRHLIAVLLTGYKVADCRNRGAVNEQIG